MERSHVAVGELVDRVDRGELLLPEIQRAYVWKPAQVASLVDSLYRGYPSGAMLFWRPDEDVVHRRVATSLSGAKPSAAPQFLLDGQQRLTSLHRVFRGHDDANVVFNVQDKRFQIQSAATSRDARWVRVFDVLNADKISPIRKTICDAVPELDEDDVADRLQRLKAIVKAEYYVEILTGLTYVDVADIFVRVNSRGRALKTVDLTLAVLSAAWPGVVGKIEEQTTKWAARDWPAIDASFLVRALAATATDAGSLGRLPKTSTDELEAGWLRVIHGTEFLVKLLGENAGIRTSSLIPSMNALVPLVTLLGQYGGKKEFTESDAVVYWLLSVFVTGRFSSAADTKIAQDALAARRKDPVQEMFKSAGLIGAPITVTPANLIGKGAGSPYFLLSFLAARKRKATDWWHGVQINEIGGSKGFATEYHHVHPQTTLKSTYAKGEINDLANLAFISATANKKISGRSPADYFPELANESRDELTPHLVPLDLELRDASAFREFLVARRAALAAAMTAILDELRPAWVAPAGDSTASPDRESVTMSLSEEPEPSMTFEARAGAEVWRVRCPLSDLERLLDDVGDGLASSLTIGDETVTAAAGADEIALPIGAFSVTGTSADWRTVIARERLEAGDAPDLGPVTGGSFAGSRRPFPVSDTD